MRHVFDTLSSAVHPNGVEGQTDGKVVKQIASARQDHDAGRKSIKDTASVPGVNRRYAKTEEKEETDRISGAEESPTARSEVIGISIPGYVSAAGVEPYRQKLQP